MDILKSKSANSLYQIGDYEGALEAYFNLSKEIGSEFFYTNIILCLRKLLNNDNLKLSEKIIRDKSNILENLYADKLIVSLTSYPARINSVEFTIKSILEQSYKAPKVILWLAEEQFPNQEKDLSKNLLQLKEKGLEIDWCEDIRSYKKLIPTLRKYPEKIIITADDDIIYEKSWLLKILLSYISAPQAISCHRAHRVSFDDKEALLDYKKWPQDIREFLDASFLNFFTGCGGVLYPPGSLRKEVLNKNLFSKLCPDADDIWFWAMAVLNYTKIKIVKNSNFKIEFTPNSQDDALWRKNVTGGHNNRILSAILSHYPDIKLNILKENKTTHTHNTPISIIVPVYNTGSYLRSCLDSLMEQSFENFELICIDDGSTDQITIEILKSYSLRDARIKILNQKNSGSASARNNGLNNSKGEYILFIDSDDHVSKDFLKNLYKSIKDDCSDLAIASNIICFDEKGNNSIKQSGFEFYNRNHAEEYASKAIITTGISWNKIYRKKFLLEKNIKYIDGMKCQAEDNYFSATAIIAAEDRISISKNTTYYWRQHNSSITKNITTESFRKSIEVYQILKEKLQNMQISDKIYWLNIINKRALKDLKYNANFIKEELDFEKIINRKFLSQIDICCIADKNYITPTAVFLQSIFQSKDKNTQLSITILVPAGEKREMLSLENFSKNDMSVTLLEIETKKFHNLHKYDSKDNFCMASPSAMFKFIIPEIFPHLDRILYIDTDLIVRKDLLELYMQPMNNEYLTAVVDMWTPVTTREDTKKFNHYFNSGVMLMNLPKMRNNNIPEKLIEEKIKSTNFSLMDQDVFNEVCNGHIKTVDIKFNFLPVCYKRHKNKFKLDDINKLYKSNYKTIDAIASDPVIVHWAGSDKPWISTNTLFADEWRKIHDHIINPAL